MLTSQTDFGALLDKTTLGPTINDMRGHQGPAQPPPAPSRGRRCSTSTSSTCVEPRAGPQVRDDAHPAAPRAVRVRGQRRVLGPVRVRLQVLARRASATSWRSPTTGSGASWTALLDVPADTAADHHHRGRRGALSRPVLEGPERASTGSKATPAELETKYGVLTAMYLPGEAPADAPSMYPDMTLINTLPIVLDRYFDAGIPLLPDHSYTSKSWTAVRPHRRHGSTEPDRGRRRGFEDVHACRVTRARGHAATRWDDGSCLVLRRALRSQSHDSEWCPGRRGR